MKPLLEVNFFNIAPQVITGLFQVAVASALVAVVVGIMYWSRVFIGKETAIAMVRGFVQILIVGVVLILIIQTTIWLGYLALALMIVFAGFLSKKHAEGLPGALKVSFIAIAAGSGLTIALMLLVGVIPHNIETMIPVGSMIIASSMRTNSLALNRFKSEIEEHVGQIEAGLALGAAPSLVVERYVTTTVRAAIIPAVDTLRSLGIVFIPGLASGMLLAGADPIYAAEYQFATMAMLFAASALTGLVAGLLLRGLIFSAAEQLTLRPQVKAN